MQTPPNNSTLHPLVQQLNAQFVSCLDGVPESQGSNSLWNILFYFVCRNGAADATSAQAISTNWKFYSRATRSGVWWWQVRILGNELFQNITFTKGITYESITTQRCHDCQVPRSVQTGSRQSSAITIYFYCSIFCQSGLLARKPYNGKAQPTNIATRENMVASRRLFPTHADNVNHTISQVMDEVLQRLNEKYQVVMEETKNKKRRRKQCSK